MPPTKVPIGRRRVGVVVSALLLALVYAATPSGGAAQAPARPNVVVILTDDQTAESMRFMDRTRRIAGRKGTSFKTLILNRALCCPSRATLLTGQYAHNHDVLSNGPPSGGFQALDGSNTLATWLEDAGYITAHVGKYLNGYGDEDRTLVPPGWTEWFTALSPIQKPYEYRLNENGEVVPYGAQRRDFKGDVFTAKALDFISRRAPSPQPFFIQVSYTAPHIVGPGPHPNPPGRRCNRASQPAPRHARAFRDEVLPRPPSFNERDVQDKPDHIRSRPRMTDAVIAKVRERYRCAAASLLHVDEGVGAIVKELRAAGELDETLVIFTSDNGVMNGEHRLDKGKGLLYEESIHVPLLVRGPGFSAGDEVRQLVTNADIAPTIVNATGAIPQRTLDGQALQPIAAAPEIADDRTILIGTLRYTGVRTDRYVYAEHHSGGKELYDLRRDPFELRSRHRSPDYRDIRTELAQQLEELRDCAGPDCRS